ncbi:MAG: toxin-activating lysine-acyltransferase [Calothrix sp. FI2-JRJ7]|jgi:cytolysin-activating lysine-acyltransferase|nr:toxin-activating lysine-acyltransferase [Calothrix sp. FI2-JRJ7]
MQLLSEPEMPNTTKSHILTPDKQQTNRIKSFSVQQRLNMIGSITHLMMSSPLHRKYNVADIAERFVPALIHNQFRYYEINGSPIGFVNWAWLSDEAEQKFMTGKYVLNLDEWLGGNNLWFPEFIAPFGHARLIVKDLRTNILPKGTLAKSLKIRPDGSLRSISYWTV